MVVFFHWCFLFNIADPAMGYKPWRELEPFARYGHLGVQLFFMISGFLILQSAYSKNVGSFLKARALRLYPAYLTCCALTYVIWRWLGDGAMSVYSFLYNLTMFNGVIDSIRRVPTTYVDGVYWTLAIEWKFYLLLALLITCQQLSRIDRVLWAWAIACFAYALHPLVWLDTYLIASLGAYFIAGATFFRARMSGWNGSRILLAVIAFGLALTQAVRLNNELEAFHHRNFSVLATILVVSSFFLFFALLSANPQRRHRSTNAFLTLLGALSYPIYLLHQQLGAIAIPRLWSIDTRNVLLAAALILLIGLSLIVHFGVERTVWAAQRYRSRRIDNPLRTPSVL